MIINPNSANTLAYVVWKFSGGTTGGAQSNLVYINPDNTDFAPLECTPGVNYMINPIALRATSATTYNSKKLFLLKSGNWQVNGTGFTRNRNIDSDRGHTLRVNMILDGTTSELFENTVDTGIYSTGFPDNRAPVIVPTGKTAQIDVSVRNTALYGGNIVAWCIN